MIHMFTCMRCWHIYLIIMFDTLSSLMNAFRDQVEYCESIIRREV